MVLDKKRLIGWGVFVVCVLLIPWVGMRFSDEINWTLSDFTILGFVLGAIGLFYEGVVRRSKRIPYRLGWIMAILGAFLLLWVNGAVGLIGNEDQEANVLYGAVLIIILIGATLSRFTSMGMSMTMFLAAGIQMIVPIVALMIWPPSEISWAPSVFGVFLISAFFAFLFFLSGLLFNRSYRQERQG